MPILIDEPELEAKLQEQCSHVPVPTSKGPLAKAILRHVLDQAKAQGVDVFDFIRSHPKAPKRRTKVEAA